MPFNFRSDDPTRELRRVWKGKHPLPAGQVQNSYTPVEQKPEGSFIGAIYKKMPTKPGRPQTVVAGKKWLGKPGFSQRGFETSTAAMQTRSLTRRGLDAIAEKIAGDAYHVANRGRYIIPKHRLASVPILHELLKEGDRLLAGAFLDQLNRSRAEPITHAIHIFSKWVEGYQGLDSVQTRFQGNSVNFMDCLITHHHLPETVLVDDREIPLVGLMDVLAAARLLGDTDVLGGGGGNAGIVVQRNPAGEPIVAVIVKIDPGFAFNFRGIENKFHQTRAAISLGDDITEHMLQDLKDIQLGNSQPVTIQWSTLSETQRLDFFLALDHANGAFQEGKMIEMLLLRQGDFEYQGEELVSEATARTLATQWRQNLRLQIETCAPARALLEARFSDRQRAQEHMIQTWVLALQGLTSREDRPATAARAEPAPARQAPIVQQAAAQPPRAAQQPQVQRQRPAAEAAAAPAHPALGEAMRGQAFFSPAQPQPHSPHSRVAAPRVDQAAVNQLLLHVARGEQDEAQVMLEDHPELLLHKGQVTDYSNRTFKNITAFQVALWALDWHMWKMLRSYLPDEDAKAQLHDLEANGTEHGKHYDFTPLTQALRPCVDAYNCWKSDLYKHHWCKVVGLAQTQVPAHVANEYCRSDRAFYPTPSFLEPTLPRNLALIDGGTYFPLICLPLYPHPFIPTLGRDFAYLSGCCRIDFCGSPVVTIAYATAEVIQYDYLAVTALCKVRTTQLDELKRELEPVPTRRLGVS